MPTTARWLLKSFRAQLACSATVANRQVRFVIDDGTTIFYSAYANAPQAAGSTAVYNFIPGGPASYTITGSAGSVESQVLAPVRCDLFAGWRIRTVTDALQAGDQWSIVSYAVEDWIEL